MSDLKFIHKTNLPVKERKMMWLFDLMDASFKKKMWKWNHCRISQLKHDFYSACKCTMIFLKRFLKSKYKQIIK